MPIGAKGEDHSELKGMSIQSQVCIWLGLVETHSEDASCTMATDTKGVYDISIINCHDAVANCRTV